MNMITYQFEIEKPQNNTNNNNNNNKPTPITETLNSKQNKCSWDRYLPQSI